MALRAGKKAIELIENNNSSLKRAIEEATRALKDNTIQISRSTEKAGLIAKAASETGEMLDELVEIVQELHRIAASLKASSNHFILG